MWRKDREEMKDERVMHFKEREAYQKERRDLYDRIQAGTLPQFKEYEDLAAPEKEPEPDVVSFDDAREELMGDTDGE